jgi:glutamate synthase domain-containing protein 1
MCGIVGFLDKTGNRQAPVGQTLLDMLSALARRGPDSSGVALYGDHGKDRYVVRIKLGEQGPFDTIAAQVIEQVNGVGSVLDSKMQGPSLRLLVASQENPKQLEQTITSTAAQIEVVSMGRRLEVVKQVGSPANLEATYAVSALVGTHGIGHTRMSTESRVDLSHSQPFWAHGRPDVAVVHNGHITNYHKMRRIYEQQGHRFYTGNDSEIIGLYIADQMSQGASFEEALQTSLKDFDGAFSYLAATDDCLGYVKDPFAFKPLVVTETAAYVAIATEEQALRTALGDDFSVWEPGVNEVVTWRSH